MLGGMLLDVTQYGIKTKTRAIGVVDCTRASCQASDGGILDTICPVQCTIARHRGLQNVFVGVFWPCWKKQ